GSPPLRDIDEATEWAKEIGYPVMLKASAGGGGRGMRVVHNPSDLAVQFMNAQEEARNAFGNGEMYMEKYLEEPKHIEIQLFGDGEGNVVHLFERDCSIQRRYQKVLEEGPSNLPEPLREEIAAAALRL